MPPPPEFAPPVETDATPDEVMSCPSDPVMVVVLRVSRNFQVTEATYKKVVDTGCPALLILLAELAMALLRLASSELCDGERLLLAAAAEDSGAAEDCAPD